MTERNDEQIIRDAYIRMYEGMIKKDESILREVLDDSFVLAPDLAERVLAAFRSGKPFLDYVNRAIDFCREEKQEYFTSLDF